MTPSLGRRPIHIGNRSTEPARRFRRNKQASGGFSLFWQKEHDDARQIEIALSAKRGDTKKSELKGASRGMYESMTEKELEELAETKRKKLPDKKS